MRFTPRERNTFYVLTLYSSASFHISCWAHVTERFFVVFLIEFVIDTKIRGPWRSFKRVDSIIYGCFSVFFFLGSDEITPRTTLILRICHRDHGVSVEQNSLDVLLQLIREKYNRTTQRSWTKNNWVWRAWKPNPVQLERRRQRRPHRRILHQLGRHDFYTVYYRLNSIFPNNTTIIYMPCKMATADICLVIRKWANPLITAPPLLRRARQVRYLIFLFLFFLPNPDLLESITKNAWNLFDEWRCTGIMNRHNRTMIFTRETRIFRAILEEACVVVCIWKGKVYWLNLLS